MELNSSNETTTTNDSIYYNSSSTISSIETSTPLLMTTTETSTQSHDNPIGIKIKEITKPEEIRITDDRPKIFKPIKSSEIVPTKSSTSLHSTETLIEPDYSLAHQAPLAVIPDEFPQIQSEIQPEIEQHTTFTFDGSADQPIQLESTDLNTVGDVSLGQKIVRQTDQDEVYTTIAPLSSENEIKDDILTMISDHVTEAPVESSSVIHNTSVLQVGDSVVIFDRSGQTQSIPLRVAGLQRGEDNDEDDERKEARKTDGSTTAGYSESSSIDTILEQSTQVFEVFYYEPKDISTVSLDFPSSESEINTASDEGFIHGVTMNKDFQESVISAKPQNIDITSEKPLEDIEDSSGDFSFENFSDKIPAASTIFENVYNITEFDYEGSSSTSDEISTNSDYLASSTSSSYLFSSEPTTEDDDIVQHDQNINFPHITDDLSIHGSRMEDRMEEEEKLRANSRVIENDLEKVEIQPVKQNSLVLTEVLPVKSNNSISDSTSTVAPLENLKESNSFNDTEPRSPGEPLLVPEWERNHTTVAPFELSEIINETTEDNLLTETSSHPIDDESTTNQSDLSSSTDIIETNPSTSESHQNYDVESIDTEHTSDISHVKETNNLNLFLDGTADFFKIQNKIWNSAVA